MAELSFSMPKELTDKLSNLQKTAEYAPKMLEAEQNVTYPEVIRRLQPHRHSATDSLVDHIVKTKPKMDKNGVWRAQIKPTGKDKKGVSNNQKMLSLEYGTSKQVATPILRPARAATEGEAKAAAQKVFNEAVGK